jgi:hypothetical protein
MSTYLIKIILAKKFNITNITIKNCKILSNTPLVITSRPEIKLIPKIKTFLESVSRNGKGSERAYDAALVCFDHLKEKYQVEYKQIGIIT